MSQGSHKEGRGFLFTNYSLMFIWGYWIAEPTGLTE